MYKIPNTFKKKNEDYITVLPLMLFAKNHKSESLNPSMNREDLLNGIEIYANNSIECADEVDGWLDDTIKEGIKDIYVRQIDMNPFVLEQLRTDTQIKKIMDDNICSKDNQHFRGNVYSKKYRLVKYTIDNNERGKVLTCYLCKLIHIVDGKGLEESSWYPAIVQVYFDKSLIVSRVKSKANMYEYMPEGFLVEMAETTSSDKEGAKAMDYVMKCLGISFEKNKSGVSDLYKKKLYLVLEKFTDTPQEIVDYMILKDGSIVQVAKMVMNDICNVSGKYYKDILYDVQNMVEKYLSISRADKTIFTKNRKAYPVTMSATDEEESKVEQTAAFEEPLQSKAVFFDNKKMLQKGKKCDGVSFRYKRTDKLYASEDFRVKCMVKRDMLIFKFTEYTLEEDINYVLFSIIDAQ